MADVPAVPPVAPPALTRRQALQKATEYSNNAASCDAQIAKNMETMSHVMVYDTAGNYSQQLYCNTTETRNALKAFLKTLRDLHEAKCQEVLLQAVEAEKL